MSDFVNVTNEVALATLADPSSVAMAAGKSIIADGVIYTSDGVKWESDAPLEITPSPKK